jgi:hypothetical protein
LYVKLQNNTLTAPEHQELTLLNDMIEQRMAERILWLGELAQLRHVSIVELSKEFKTKLAHA